MDGTIMSIPLPGPFVERMRQQLGDELPAFLRAVDEPALRGIRINPMKPTAAAMQHIDGAMAVPWSDNAYYLPAESNAGATIMHEAGAFYIQEPAAMLPAMLMNAGPGEKILDLCAAPGGKSTQIGCAMKGQGLLVCNEPIPKRAKVLSANIERIGIPNAVVTCAWPEKLAEQWPDGFDAVLVDAPCSGEGMFRRDPETRKEWTPEKAEGCFFRQREILAAAVRLVRPGGRLIYSTCTYNPAENEGNARWLTDSYPEFRSEPFALPGITAPEGMYTCYPHRLKCEGQFVAAFRKAGDQPAVVPEDQSVPKPARSDLKTLEQSFPAFPKATHLFGQTMVSVQELPDIRGIKVLRTGLHLGEIRGKVFVPDHAAALCFPMKGIKTFDLSPEEAVEYMAGGIVPGDAEGWTLLCYRGLAVGWGKGSEGIIKNHYPKGLRSRTFIP